jgi:opacity protein-like surface antigen
VVDTFMSRYPVKSLLLASLVLLAPSVHAADAEGAAAPAITHDLYVGVGLFDELMHVNVETVTRWGNFMLRAGRFHKIEPLAVNMSWRKPLDSDDGNATGFYAGFFGGQIIGEEIDEEARMRLGAGAEMGYQWVREYTRSEITVGLGAAEAIKEGDVEHDTVPTLFISYRIALGY